MGGGCQNIVLLKKKKERERKKERHKGNELKRQKKKGQNEIENSNQTGMSSVVGRVEVPGPPERTWHSAASVRAFDKK